MKPKDALLLALLNLRDLAALQLYRMGQVTHYVSFWAIKRVPMVNASMFQNKIHTLVNVPLVSNSVKTAKNVLM
jgi:hypothetical protein